MKLKGKIITGLASIILLAGINVVQNEIRGRMLSQELSTKEKQKGVSSARGDAWVVFHEYRTFPHTIISYGPHSASEKYLQSSSFSFGIKWGKNYI